MHLPKRLVVVVPNRQDDVRLHLHCSNPLREVFGASIDRGEPPYPDLLGPASSFSNFTHRHIHERKEPPETRPFEDGPRSIWAKSFAKKNDVRANSIHSDPPSKCH